jgi:hypothetical protein
MQKPERNIPFNALFLCTGNSAQLSLQRQLEAIGKTRDAGQDPASAA